MKKYFENHAAALAYCANNGIPKTSISQTVFSWLNYQADVKVWTVTI